jgi:hypothetical protein
MVGGIGAALVILLVVAAGALLYRYIYVSYSFWSIIFYINMFLGYLPHDILLVVVAGVSAT